MYVCMFFKDISRSRALSESKVVSCCSPVNSTLHRHDVIIYHLVSIGDSSKVHFRSRHVHVMQMFLLENLLWMQISFI